MVLMAKWLPVQLTSPSFSLCRSYGVALWFPSYVQEINVEQDRKDFERFCSQQASGGINDEELRRFDGCSNTVFENATLNRTSLNDWRIYSATFRNVTFLEANFSKVVFEDCEFVNCTMEGVQFNWTYFVNSEWNSVAFDRVWMQFSDVCVPESQNITVLDEISLYNSTVNGISPDVSEVNQTLFLQLLSSDRNFTCVGAPKEEECEQTNENRVYRDNFFISASALPGNIASAIAVYFLRRNYWLGKEVCGRVRNNNGNYGTFMYCCLSSNSGACSCKPLCFCGNLPPWHYSCMDCPLWIACSKLWFRGLGN